jgi:hypothetical protein
MENNRSPSLEVLNGKGCQPEWKSITDDAVSKPAMAGWQQDEWVGLKR